mmetsp:Transcript_19787/g.56174  ORF Transcript_19787/g.56174 Transcript_19787/m.56174 type:complete len:257 (-) Transcript_19787:1094-1864(-)
MRSLKSAIIESRSAMPSDVLFASLLLKSAIVASCAATAFSVFVDSSARCLWRSPMIWSRSVATEARRFSKSIMVASWASLSRIAAFDASSYLRFNSSRSVFDSILFLRSAIVASFNAKACMRCVASNDGDGGGGGGRSCSCAFSNSKSAILSRSDPISLASESARASASASRRATFRCASRKRSRNSEADSSKTGAICSGDCGAGRADASSSSKKRRCASDSSFCSVNLRSSSSLSSQALFKSNTRWSKAAFSTRN